MQTPTQTRVTALLRTIEIENERMSEQMTSEYNFNFRKGVPSTDMNSNKTCLFKENTSVLNQEVGQNTTRRL